MQCKYAFYVNNKTHFLHWWSHIGPLMSRYSMGLWSGIQSLMKHIEAFDGSPMRHVVLWFSMLRSLMGLRAGMLVSEWACRGLRWVSDQACRSLMGLRLVPNRSPKVIIFSRTRKYLKDSLFLWDSEIIVYIFLKIGHILQIYTMTFRKSAKFVLFPGIFYRNPLDSRNLLIV